MNEFIKSLIIPAIITFFAASSAPWWLQYLQPSGQWCGLAGHDSNLSFECAGHNPAESCPSNYIQVSIAVNGGTLVTNAFQATTHYVCISK